MSRRNTNTGQVAGRLFRGEARLRDTKKDAVSDPSRALRTRDGGYNKPKALGRTWSRFFITILVATFFPAHALAQKSSAQKPVAPTGVQIVSNAGEPELRVDGIPFFLHAAQFDYFRIPPDLWFRSLDRYRELGINTIDLRIPWNWHEIGDAEFDFDGHTNPRRNLRGLLQLIAEKHLRIVARPGPLIGDHWRNAGYPAWLLAYSDYKMDESAIEAGLATPDAEIGGPLLFVALDDAVAIRNGSTAPDLSRYLSELRRALERGGLDSAS